MAGELSRIVGCRIGSMLGPCALALTFFVLASTMAVSVPTAVADCPNEDARVGPSATLPDCRAYELVTPPEANGRVLTPPNVDVTRESVPTDLEALGGNSFIYLAFNSPLLAPGGASGIFDVYEATRSADGWQTARRRSPDGDIQELQRATPGGIEENHGYAFSFLGESMLIFPDNSLHPLGIGRLGREPRAQGRYISPGAEHIIFTTGSNPGSIWCSQACPVAQLEPNAPPTGIGAIYDRSPTGPTKVVSLLPGNIIPTQTAIYQGASRDGSAVAFKIGDKLYVRVDNTETKEVTATEAGFAGLSSDGSYLFYVAGGDQGSIHRFNTETGADVAIAPTSEGQVVNVSADGSHLYFVSLDALTGGEVNGQGETARPPARGTGTLHAAEGSGTLSKGSTEISGLSTSKGEFEPGMEITSASHGFGIPPGTTIVSVGSGSLTISQPASATASPVVLLAGSKQITGLSTSEGEFKVGMEIQGDGIPEGTTITGVGSGTLGLSRPATHAGSSAVVAGFPNLYVWSDDPAASAHPVRYVATVVASDLERTSGALEAPMPSLTTWTPVVSNPNVRSTGRYEGLEQGPGADSSRTTPDGDILVFESRAQLTPYDNGGHTEIYRFGPSDSIRCLSCNPLQSPTGDARLENLTVLRPGIVVHNLSDDGTRVFFETPEALVSRDTDGVNDIYQWREEGETGSVDLISSGRSVEHHADGTLEEPWFPRPNVLFSVTPSGDNVFFLTEDELVEGAGGGGTPGIYDARVNGGFPKSLVPEACAEEGCRPAPHAVAPKLLGSRSEATGGSGNVRPHKHRCRRKHRQKGRHRHCAKTHCSTKSKRSRRRLCGKRRSHRSRAHASSEVQQGAAAADADEGGSEAERAESTPAEPKRVATTATTSAPAASAETTLEPFGFRLAEAGLSPTVAGAHPDFTTQLVFNHKGKSSSELPQKTERLTVDLPPGLAGNPNAIPQCKMGEAVAWMTCPPASQVGVTKILVTDFPGTIIVPVFNVEPPHPDREIARLGFLAGVFPAFIDIHVRTAGDFGVAATVVDTSGLSSLLEAETVLWGNPAASSHDKNRLVTAEALPCASQDEFGIACEQPGHERESPIAPNERKAFLTNPSACQSSEVGFTATSYQLPGQIFQKSAPLSPITDCAGLPFAPIFAAEPTSHAAGAPTGLKTKLTIPQHLGEEERATATMREARVTLPAGMQVAAGAANWIGTCSDSEVGFHEEVDARCPDSSKLGTATIVSPDLPEPIDGTIYQRSPRPGHQLGLWLTSDALGLHIKLPGELEPDKQSGRLTAVFRDLPQVPVEEIDLNIWGGPRAPLQNPDHCGAFTTDFSFTPHSQDPAATGQSTMQITEGCNQGFSPTLHAGVDKPIAGKFSPFGFDLNRDDGQQALRGFELKLPDGELAKLKGVPLCSNAEAAAATCPEASRIGSLSATTGPGPEPLDVPQPGKPQPQIYLAGPYQGAPFSIVSEVPAQAGPFDLGVLTVHSGLDVEPETGRALVKADPLPQFFEGIGIAYRHLHAVIDRPGFSLNPTDCREMAVTSDVTSTQGRVAHPSARFQLDGCKRLKFKPELSLKLHGGTKRAGYPALTAILKARKRDANIAFASVALPHSEFLAQEHIGTICTRKQFARDKCPKGSIYGKAKAWTPLLGKPLSGPVYLRSSDHPLPDLVAKLGGQLEIDLVGRIDSVHGGIRTTFESVPDAPVSRFVLKMKGGKKGLLANSTDICQGKHRARVELKAQNGRVVVSNPAVTGPCGPKLP